MKCIATCKHIYITKELLEQAKRDNEDMLKQKGKNNPTTLILNEENDIIGSLGQNAMFVYMDLRKIEYKKTRFFDKNIHQDSCDFECGKASFDVKCSPTSKDFPSVFGNSRLLVKNASKGKYVDYYVFAKITEKKVVHLVGYIGYRDFWEKKGKPFVSSKVKEPCTYVLVSDLVAFK